MPTSKDLFADPRGEPRGARRALRVLIVEDDHDAMMTLMLLLHDEGHEVRGVRSGKQALVVLRYFEPDAVLIDISVPELSGWELARAIRARYEDKSPLMIGISGQYIQGSDRVLSEIVGLHHYLVKPYDPQALLKLLEPLTLPSFGR